MNIELIVISVILVALVFLPFILIPLVQNRGNNNLKKKFKDEADRLGLNIDIKELWNCNFIGIDSAQKKLLFVQKIDEAYVLENIDLSTVSQSRVIVAEIEKKVDKKEITELQRVDLEFTISATQQKKLINLYDSDINFIQDLEVKHAENWNNQISQFINSRPVLKKTA